jgi:GPH family glycoside/pentoside/hexuronide:cation symporter
LIKREVTVTPVNVRCTCDFNVYYFLHHKRTGATSQNQETTQTRFKDLLSNRPWWILLITALFSSSYNAIKQGIIIIYFTHYLHTIIG